MSPRPGGEADKFGARYEGAWTVWRVLEILGGTGRAITVEVAGELAEGAEFLYERAADGIVEAHQVKRQQGTANGWTVKSLHDLDIWSNAEQQIEKAREFHFASTTPATKLAELADRARRSGSLEDFIKNGWLTKKLGPQFDELGQGSIYGSPEHSWQMLRRMYFHCLDEDSLVNHNAGVSGLLLEGAFGRLASVGLGDLVLQNLGVRLNRESIEQQIGAYGLQRTTADRTRAWTESVANITSRWQASVRRELLSPAIKRAEAVQLVSLAGDPTKPISFLVGSAGGGKSATLVQAVDSLLQSAVPVLAFRLDWVGEVDTTQELGLRLGLDASPVAALASAASGRPSVIVIDQLDAVSLASGRIPTNFGAVEDLIREAAAFPNLHVTLVCRQFDVENDFRIRTLRAQVKAETITVAALSDLEVDAAVSAMSLDSSALSGQQRSLLSLPLHLVLLAQVADEPGALNFHTTAHLFDAYWRRKRQMIEERKPGVRFMEVVTTLTTAISDKQQLAISDTVLDAENLAQDGDAFISEHVLVRNGQRIAFFHEAFFDYAFARQWSESDQTMVQFLTAKEQELFRRAQVRQILHHLRSRDTSRYLLELRSAVTSPAVRFHLKEVMLAVLGSLSDPTAAELRIVLDAADVDPALAANAWQNLRTGSWFARLDAEGQLDAWLSSDESVERDRAVSILGSATRTSPDRVAAILVTYSDHSDYFDWLFWITRFGEIQNSRSLFDLLRGAVHAGAADGREHLLWLSAYWLADHEPVWAIELLKAYFIEWPGGLALDAEGKIQRLGENDHGLSELISKSAAAEPARFITDLLPYVTDVMQATARPEHRRPGLPTDPHFSYYYGEMAEASDADDALHVAMRSAIESTVRIDPTSAIQVLETLEGVRLNSAQSLLYIGLIAGGAAYTDWSAALLLDTDRLFCSTNSNPVWMARELIETISPRVNSGDHAALEDAVRDLRFDWEGRQGGYHAFTLLSAMAPDRLSELGRRRLGEYQRKFEIEQPPEPSGITGGWIGSPIASQATPKMSDRNWLQAMTKHDSDKTDFNNWTGGARELAHLLQQETKSDPLRFAHLATSLTTETNSAYGDAILLGLGEAEAVDAADRDTVFAAVRHIAGLMQPANDRWLGSALRPYLKEAPLDLVEVLKNRAVSAADPVSDRDTSDDERHPGEGLRSRGMNSARGSAAEELGNLLVFDVDGSRTAAVVPVLMRLADDPVMSVRSQAAYTISASLRYARPAAVAAFSQLVRADDALLASGFLQQLMMYIGNGGDNELVLPVIERMIASEHDSVRQRGGALAVVAALDWASADSLGRVMASTDPASRKGVAEAAAARVSSSRNARLAAKTLEALFDDPDEGVRQAAAQVAPNLRGSALRSYVRVLIALIDSASFEQATPQLFLTLEYAPDEVGSLVLRAAQRFIEVFGSAAGDIRTGAAGDSRYVSDLIVRGLAQSQDPNERSALLDVVDELLRIGAYGVNNAVDGAER